MLAAQLPPDCLHNSHTVTALRADGTVDVGGTTHRFDLVVGADGARGVSRRSLCPDAPPPRSTGIKGWAWIVDHEMSSGFGPIWGRTADFGILPLTDGRTYVYGGRVGGADLGSFRDWPDPLPALIDAATPEQMSTPEIFEARPPRALVHGRAVLIGDAAHTMRPTFGQGAALAMEDAITLASLGTQGLTRRRARMWALYSASKAGSYFATPRVAPLEFARNTVLRIAPDTLFGVMAGAVAHWQPPD
jgi:2-polyprenyl-6-methoxyphenol hydroxylase-like FAD-dependent oxidoreductase